jgi:hypothetical protein
LVQPEQDGTHWINYRRRKLACLEVCEKHEENVQAVAIDRAPRRINFEKAIQLSAHLVIIRFRANYANASSQVFRVAVCHIRTSIGRSQRACQLAEQ